MRRAMKAISAHAVPTVELVRQRVEICHLPQRVVKRGVEHRDLRNTGPERGARRRDAAQVMRIVQRREVDQLLESAPNVVIDTRRLCESLAAVHDAVPHGFDLADLRDRYTGFVARQPGDDVLDGGRVIADRRCALYRPTTGRLERQDSSAADAV